MNFDSGSGSAGIGTSGRKKTGKFVNLWIDFRKDIFPVYSYSESESKSIQRVTNFPAFFLPDILYRHCRNRNRNSWFLFRSPPSLWLTIAAISDKRNIFYPDTLVLALIKTLSWTVFSLRYKKQQLPWLAFGRHWCKLYCLIDIIVKTNYINQEIKRSLLALNTNYVCHQTCLV